LRHNLYWDFHDQVHSIGRRNNSEKGGDGYQQISVKKGCNFD